MATFVEELVQSMDFGEV